MGKNEKSPFDKKWILENGIPIVKRYSGKIDLTLRALHYRLVALGMTNDIQHYKKVVSAMISARWDGDINFWEFKDHERETIGLTSYETTDVESSVDIAKRQIRLWARSYSKNRWENQPFYPEVFIEKKAIQGFFEDVCHRWDVALNPCKGYPSLTYQFDAKERFKKAQREGKTPIILYFGDYDCSGEDIPRSIHETIYRMGIDVEVRRIALMEHQVIEWGLPPAPSKETDTRSAKWDGLGQVELDAVEPNMLVELTENAIKSIFNDDLYDDLIDQQDKEIDEFKGILIRDFKTLLDEED